MIYHFPLDKVVTLRRLLKMVHLSDKIESKLISSSQSCIFFRRNENIILNWVDPPRQNIKNFLILSLDKAFKNGSPLDKIMSKFISSRQSCNFKT